MWNCKRLVTAIAVCVCVGGAVALRESSQPHNAAGQPQVDHDQGQAAFESLERAAEAGDPWAMYFYGRLHLSRLIGQTPEQVHPASTYPAEAQTAWAWNVAALGGADFDADADEAVAWTRKAAAKGIAPAMTNLGFMSLHGLGVAQDNAEALKWYDKAAEAGEPNAMNSVGASYLNGMRGKNDPAQAHAWFVRAAEHGLPEAQNNVGLCYESGWGVTPDPGEAVAWYRKAAAQGHAGAMRALGEHTKAGSGVAKDERAAMQWFQKAADLGDAAAMRLLGPYYLSGKLVPKDETKGLALFAGAARKGDSEAFGFLLFREAIGDKHAADLVAAIRGDKVDVDENAAQAYAKKQLDLVKALEEAAKESREEAAAKEKLADELEARLKDPGPAPRFASAREWDQAYRTAPYLTSRAFLDRLDAVRLRVIRSTTLLDLGTDAWLTALVKEQIGRKGLRVDPAAPVLLEVTLDLRKSTARKHSTRYGDTSRDNHVLVALFEFKVPARVRRGQEFHHLLVAPVSYLDFTTAGDSYTRGDVEENVADLVDFAWERLRTPGAKPHDDTPWRASLWKPAQAEKMYAKYQGSTARQAEDLERVVAGVSEIGRVEHDLTAELTNGDKWAGKTFITDAEVLSAWRRALPTADLQLANDGSPVYVLHDTFAFAHAATDIGEALLMSDLEMFYALISDIRLRQDDVVYELGPDLYRSNVTLINRHETHISFLKDAEDEMPDFVKEHVGEVVNELRFLR